MLIRDREKTTRAILKNYKNWRPYPKYEEEEKWASLDENIKKVFLDEAETYLGTTEDWKILPPTIYMLPVRTGNRSLWMDRINGRIRTLIVITIAECIERKGRYIDDIFNASAALCETGCWGFPPNDVTAEEPYYNVLKPRVDLTVGDVANCISLVYYIMGEKLSGISSYILPQMKDALLRNIIDPMDKPQYDYFWIGNRAWSNWSPWICSNVMLAMFLTCDDERKISRIMDTVYVTLEKYYSIIDDDCGNLEGATYWPFSAGKLYQCLKYLQEVTGGETEVFADKKIKGMARNIFDLHLTGPYVFNYGDASAKNNAYCRLLYNFAKSTGAEDIQSFAVGQIKKYGYTPAGRNDFRENLDWAFDYSEIMHAEEKPYVKKDAWYEKSHYLIARSGGGLIMTCRAGELGVNHSHHDVGAFTLFKNGSPVFIDIGSETYCQKTFSPERWTLWIMQSSWHNLPEINGIREELGGKGADIKEISMSDDSVRLTVGLDKTFAEGTGLERYVRDMYLDKKADTFTVTDGMSFTEGDNNKVAFNLICAERPTYNAGGSSILAGGSAALVGQRIYSRYRRDSHNGRTAETQLGRRNISRARRV